MSYAEWQSKAGLVIAEGRRMLKDPDTYGPHIDEVSRNRETVKTALEKIEALLEADRKAGTGQQVADTDHSWERARARLDREAERRSVADERNKGSGWSM